MAVAKLLQIEQAKTKFLALQITDYVVTRRRNGSERYRIYVALGFYSKIRYNCNFQCQFGCVNDDIVIINTLQI